MNTWMYQKQAVSSNDAFTPRPKWSTLRWELWQSHPRPLCWVQQWVQGSLLHAISIQCFDFLWKAYSHSILQFILHRVRAVGAIASKSLDLGREIKREATWSPARISVWLAVVCISPAFTASNILCFQNPPSPLPVAHLFPSAILAIVTSRLSSWTSVSTDSPLLRLPDVMVGKQEVASGNTKSVAFLWGLWLWCYTSHLPFFLF